MSYRLILKPSAERELDRLLRHVQERIVHKLAELEANPRPAGTVKLSGTRATYRLRSGDYRIVYEIDDAQSVVFVTAVAHRREVYRRM